LGIEDLAELLDHLAHEAAELLGAERASVFLLDESRSELTSQVALGSDRVLSFDARLGIAGAVALGGESIVVPDAKSDDRFYPGIDQRTGFVTRSILAAPLLDPSGESIGAIEVLNRKQGTFDDADREVLESVARHAARAIGDARAIRELRAQNERLRRDAKRLYSTEAIVGTHPRVRAIVQLIEEIRDTSVNVLVTGETGTGKELIARAIHGSSPRAGGPLFLDEIGDLPAAAQAKILRALQERIVERVGGRNPVPVDVRVVAATNRDLGGGDFRADLYYRLKVVHIETPALREIPEDIPLLAGRLLARKCADLGREPKRLAPDAVRRLRAHAWPGNVRELENEMTRLAAAVRRDEIRAEDLSLPEGPGGPGTLKDAVAALERQMIDDALRACGGNKAQAARRLGLSRQGFLNKLRRIESARE